MSKSLNHYILPSLHEGHPYVVLPHIGSNGINNQTKDRINTEKLTCYPLLTLVSLTSILV